LISAFQTAFPQQHGVRLLLKVNRADAFPLLFARLQQAAARLNVNLLTGVWPRQELMNLVAACDCFVSLHRAEGFGYTVAEAMLLGKPVIATDYSATTEFLTPDLGLPVRYTLTQLQEDYGPYRRGNRWAEPDLDDAAEKMRWVHQHRATARELGARAAVAVAERFSVQAFAQRLNERLDVIEANVLKSQQG
jgi:glycosyltransferase involved in cell wall biosynthesis